MAPRNLAALAALLALLLVPFAWAADPEPKDKQLDLPAAVASLWTVTDAVLDHHVQPTTRQEMLLAATQALLANAKVAAPVDLARRVSGVATAQEYVKLLEDLLTIDGKAPTIAAQELESSAIPALLQKAPGRASFVPAGAQKVSEQINANRYVGVGIQLRIHVEEGFPQIVTPLRGGPVHKAGIKASELIVEVDGKSTQGMPLRDVVDLLRGDEGTNVTIAVRPPGTKEARTIKLTRSVVPFENVAGYRRDAKDQWVYGIAAEPKIAYVQVRSLVTSTLHELRQAEKAVLAENAQAIVLDMRYCPGGAFAYSLALADGLLDEALIGKVTDRAGRVKEHRADRDCLFRDLPMVVLVDGYLVQGSEFVVAALQDNKQAVIVGDVMAGDGYVRNRVDLPGNLGTLNLATGIYERPKQPKEQGPAKGLQIMPDHVVKLTQEQRQNIVEWQQVRDRTELTQEEREKTPDDPHLAKAIEILKAAMKK